MINRFLIYCLRMLRPPLGTTFFRTKFQLFCFLRLYKWLPAFLTKRFFGKYQTMCFLPDTCQPISVAVCFYRIFRNSKHFGNSRISVPIFSHIKDSVFLFIGHENTSFAIPRKSDAFGEVFFRNKQKNNALHENESAEGIGIGYLFGIFNFIPL